MKPDYYKRIWNKVLSSGEEIKYEFGISDQYIRMTLIFLGIISAVILIFLVIAFTQSSFNEAKESAEFVLLVLMFAIPILGICFYNGFYLRRANAYAFTNKRVLIHEGWLSTSLNSIDYGKITEIEINEGFFERTFFKTGSMTITTAAQGLYPVILSHIDQPYEIKKQLEKIKSEVKI
jgi:membrane protein YdbS with pleckstrin-like domain